MKNEEFKSKRDKGAEGSIQLNYSSILARHSGNSRDRALLVSQ